MKVNKNHTNHTNHNTDILRNKRKHEIGLTSPQLMNKSNHNIEYSLEYYNSEFNYSIPVSKSNSYIDIIPKMKMKMKIQRMIQNII